MTMNRKILWVIIAFVAILLGWFGWRFLQGQSAVPLVESGLKIARVDVKKAMQIHPSYNAYVALEKEISDLENEYAFDREEKSLEIRDRLGALSENTASIDQGFIDSLNDELKAKIQAKEDELNGKLAKKQQELFEQITKESAGTTQAADLRIVNLQLELRSNVHPVIISAEQKKAYQEVRKKKQEELEQLLAKRGDSIDGNAQDIKVRMERAMKPFMEAAEKELADYAKSVNDALSGKLEERQKEFAKAQQEMGTLNLSNEVEWNQQWQQKLDDKQAELDALREAMMDDIRTRVGVIAKDKQIDLVITDEVANVKAIDITDAVIASY